MPRKIKLTAFAVVVLLFAVFIFAPVVVGKEALALESKDRDWDEFAVGGQLKDSATSTEYAVLMDAHTGKVLYEENANEILPPASITKIMTCLLVLENANLEDEVEINGISQERLEEEGSAVVGLENGEKITVEALLYALMLRSGGDAAEALAMHVSGSVSAFVSLMNVKAMQLELTNTRFENPIGLHDGNHYSTAMDMATLSFAAMKNDDFKKIVGTFRYEAPTTNIHNEENQWTDVLWENRNKLVSTVYADNYAYSDANGDHATGVKTGFTTPAQSTLVASAENGEGTQEVIAVVLYGTPNGRFSDAVTMFKYAFEFYDTINLVDFLTGDIALKAHIDNAQGNQDSDNLELYIVPNEDAYITDSIKKIAEIKANPNLFTKVETYTTNLVAPISKDSEVGYVEYYYNGEALPILTCKLFAAHDVMQMIEATPIATFTPVPENITPTPAPGLLDGITGNVGYIIIAVVGLLIIIIIIIILRGRNRPKPRRDSGTRGGASSRGRQTNSRYSTGVSRGRGRKR